MVTGVAAIAAVGLGLSACGSSSTSSGGGTSAVKKNLELVVGTKSDDFYVTMECGARRRPRHSA